MTTSRRATTRASANAPARRNSSQSRPQAVADTIKEWMVAQGLEPGDRLPGEPELIRHFGMAKGTIREALKVLETQGLIRTRTGPGGGAFVDAVSEQRAHALLANYLYFKSTTIGDIYQLRRALEPELAADLAGKLSREDLARLRDAMTVYEQPPQTMEEEQVQRIAELEFHEILADLSPNPLMASQCRFLVSLLKNLAVCRKIYRRRIPEFRKQGRDYQTRLLRALEEGDGETARAVMGEHMRTAQMVMEKQEAIVQRDFFNEETGWDPPPLHSRQPTPR